MGSSAILAERPEVPEEQSSPKKGTNRYRYRGCSFCSRPAACVGPVATPPRRQRSIKALAGVDQGGLCRICRTWSSGVVHTNGPPSATKGKNLSAVRTPENRVPGSQKSKSDVIRIVVADSRDLAYVYAKSTLDYDPKSGEHVRFDEGILQGVAEGARRMEGRCVFRAAVPVSAPGASVQTIYSRVT